MSDSKALYVTPLCAVVFLALIWNGRRKGTKSPFPPGPKRLPLLGNVLDISSDLQIWETFTSVAKKFNTDVIYMRLLTTDFVVLSSTEAISDLCEKRSNIYSNRPQMPMFNLMDLASWNIAFMGYGNQWRDCRRLLHRFLSPTAVTRFDDYQRKHAYRFLLRLAESPDHFLHHTEFLVGSLVMEMTYGVDIKSEDDRFLRVALEALEFVNKAGVPGAFLVDVIPILKYVPEWFPGAGFKTFARASRETNCVMVNEPLKHVKEMMKSGESGNASIAWSCFDRTLEAENQQFGESAIRAATATMYFGAMDTTVSLLHTFFLAMALNPHAMRKAQEELDKAMGCDRLPEISDQVDLPYTCAVVKEVLRWGCPAPVGMPKVAMVDDTYKGYFIPAGATIIENIWSIFRDESIYPKSHTFNPDRYLKDGKLDSSIKDPEDLTFGFGRRACSGKHFAMRSLFLNFACILTLFNIEPPVHEKLEANFKDGFVRHPAPFKCRITLRSEAGLKLIRSVCAAAAH